MSPPPTKSSNDQISSSSKPAAHPPAGGGHDASFAHHVIAGATAGLIEVLVMYPLDVVKTRLQLQKGTAKYTSVLSTFQTIIKEEGALNLYRGILSPILAEAPKRAVKFASNEIYKPIFSDAKGKLSHSGAAAAGASAGVTEAFINCPFEVVKVRLQSTDALGLYKNTMDATLKIASQEGPLALYKGLEAQLWRNLVWNGAYFGLISIMKANMWKPESKSSEMLRNFLSGFVGGAIATTLNTPFDVVKSRLQNIKTGERPWAVPALLKLYSEEGFRALYKGYVPRLLRLGPGGGIMLFAFDFISGLLKH